jgi:hypothetical protein
MMAVLQCPACGEAQVVEQIRLQDPNSGKTIGSSSLGCIYQTAFVTTLLSLLGMLFVILRPSHAFAEAVAIIIAITMIFVAAGIYVTWRHSSWSTIRQRSCKSCGHNWIENPYQLISR